MQSVSQWFDEEPRISILRDGQPQADRDCLMVWIQRAQRAHANPAINTAIELARELDLPVIAVFCLVPAFPSATLRPYHFMAEGLQELPDALATRKIGWHLETGEPGKVIPSLARKHRASVLVTDLNPLRIGRQWRDRVADRIDFPMLVVDSDTVVPSSLFTKEEYAARTIRPKIQRVLNQHLVRIPDTHAPVASDVREGPEPLEAIAQFELDTSVGPAPDFRSGEREARRRLHDFVVNRLGRYDQERNRADIDAGSQLSPYLHYGQISPIEVALAITESNVPAAAKDSFVDELIIQRELSINFVLHNADYDRYAGLPDWGRKSLAEHAGDPREHEYTRGQLEAAGTHDDLWNMAMTQMINEGWLPNRLRMYWGKQIALWSASPETAFRNTVYLNDKYFLDGRDANSYGNIGWCIGGRHDRPFGPERPVTGLVRPMGMGAMKRTFDVNAYITAIRERWVSPRLPLE
jgi:deoxyribodipyrimidine photo-lyase